MVAPVNEPILNSERSSMASRCRFSTTMNATSRTAAVTKSPTISGELQPWLFPSTSA